MGDADHDPRRWGKPGTWAVEPRAAAVARAPAIGRSFFDALFREFPALEACACFLRWSEQPDDVYAVFDLPARGAGVQIDPDLGYIIVWGRDGQAEYGDWGSDPVPAALAHVRRLVSVGPV